MLYAAALYPWCVLHPQTDNLRPPYASQQAQQVYRQRLDPHHPGLQRAERLEKRYLALLSHASTARPNMRRLSLSRVSSTQGQLASRTPSGSLPSTMLMPLPGLQAQGQALLTAAASLPEPIRAVYA